MGWFDKKNRQEGKREEIPKLPEFPRLPDLPEIEEEPISKLPSLPSSSLGQKFSQEAIKESIQGLPKLQDIESMGEEEGEEWGGIEIPSPTTKSMTMEAPEKFFPLPSRTKKSEPVFIRLDKFEDSMNIIAKTKKEIEEIEEMLRDTKKIKEEEEKELEYWETAVQNIKRDIEKIDNDIFSKIE